MDTFGEQQVYDIDFIGSYGRFSSGGSFPIEYIQTSLSMADLADLSFARDIKPKTLDFDLLMQRDIDEERVKRDMEPYLDPKLTDEEIRSKVIFFPPLLVAVIPIKGKSMEEYYPDEIGVIAPDNKIVREWSNIFKLSYFPSEAPNAYKISSISNDGSEFDKLVSKAPVRFQARSTKGGREGAALIIIDGQHRMFALKQVYEKRPELIEDLVIPVCILFSPNSTRHHKNIIGLEKVPSVPEVFRHLFVDVNTTMEQVGGHFTILLSDDDIGSLACRGLCNFILSEEGKRGLAVIEWNTKSKKDSTIIKRSRSQTSIGLIEQALSELFTKNRSTLILRMKYILHLEDIESHLYLEDENEDEPLKIEWDRFSSRQRKHLKKQIEKYLVPSIFNLLFKSKYFGQLYTIFKEELQKVEEISEGNSSEKLYARNLLEEIIDYIPIKKGGSYTASLIMSQSLEESVKYRKATETPEILKYAIFQRALFQVWGKLIDICREVKYEIKSENLTNGLIQLLDTALENNGYIFQTSRSYMQHSVFRVTTIIPTNTTRDVLSWIILSCLGERSCAKEICNILQVNNNELDNLVERLVDSGRSYAALFMEHFTKKRKIVFKKAFPLDFAALTSDEIEELLALEQQERHQLQQVKEGKLKRNDVKRVFDEAVNSYVKEDVSRAVLELKNALGYDADIILDNTLMD